MQAIKLGGYRFSLIGFVLIDAYQALGVVVELADCRLAERADLKRVRIRMSYAELIVWFVQKFIAMCMWAQITDAFSWMS